MKDPRPDKISPINVFIIERETERERVRCRVDSL